MADISPDAVEKLANRMWGPLGPFQAEVQMQCAATLRALSAEILRLRASRSEVIEMCAALADAAAQGAIEWRKTIIDYHSHEATEAGTQRDVALGLAARIRSLKDDANG